MGVDAKGLLVGGYTPLDVMIFLDSKGAKEVAIRPTGIEDFCWIDFVWHGEKRNMACHYNGACKSDYEEITPHDALHISIGKWGFSDAIITILVEKFGGFIMLDDSKDDWRAKNATV